jgi:hypothetical protein
MGGHEQDRQGVVPIGHVGCLALVRDRSALAFAARTVAAVLVDQAPRRRLQEPGARILRDAVDRPAGRGRDQRLLDGVLCSGEVAVAARERAKDLRRAVA